jgi:protein-disulfide isomerase/uncharacterized membrane protein
MKLPWMLVLRVAALVALLASAALAVDYLSANPAFCGAESGCGAVRRSGFGYLPGSSIPVPVLGIAAFSVLFTLSLFESQRKLLSIAALVGGVLGVLLLGVQAFVVGALCALCVVVDLAAVVAAVAGHFLYRSAEAVGHDPLTKPTWALLAFLVPAIPIAWAPLKPPPGVPPEVAAHFAAGKINVVEFVDFECPFCRMLHPVLKAVAAEYGDQVHFVRLDLPLASHPFARGAARAHVCGAELGKAEAMADALFESEDLSEEGLRATAQKVGLDKAQFERCLGAPSTEGRIKKTERILRDAGVWQGLPTTFVGEKMLVGAQDVAVFRDAFELAKRGESESTGVPAYAYAALVVLVLGVVIAKGRAQKPGSET